MLKLVLCLSLLGLVACYDFKDPYYNELLLEDLLESDDGPTLMDRFKRSASEMADDKCKRNHRHKCCNDMNGDVFEKFRELKKQCFNEIRSKERSARGMGGMMNPVDMFDCEKMNRAKQELICSMECVGRKQNIVDKEGNLLEAKSLVSFLKEMLAADPWQEPLLDGFVDTCLKEMAEKNEKMKMAGDSTTCNPSVSNFCYCMWRQNTLACPKDKQDPSKKCERMREKIANNEPFMMDHHDHDK